MVIAFALSSNGAFAGCDRDTIFSYSFAPGSTVKIPTSRNINSYDANGNLIRDLRQSWDAATSTWVNAAYYTYTYDAANHETSFTTQYWVSGAWRNSSLTTSTYNASNYLIKKVVQHWNTTGPWLNYSIDEYAYNASGLVIDNLYGSWNTTTSSWDYQGDEITNYTASGKASEITTLNYDGTSWVNTSRYIFTYDANNNELTRTTQNWNTTASVWDNFQLIEYTYNSSNQTVLYIYKEWDIPSLSWKNKSRIDYGYLSNTKMGYKTNATWNITSSAWVFGSQYLYTYTAANLLDTETTQYYNTTSFTWQNINLIDHNYDVNGNEIEIQESNWNTTTSNWQFTSRKTFEFSGLNLVAQDQYSSWSSAGGFYNTHERYEYHCLQLNVGIHDVSSNVTFSIYPNPVSSGIFHITTVEESDYTLSDFTGKQLQNGTLTVGDNQIQFPAITAGVYIVRVGHQTQKIVVQ